MAAYPHQHTAGGVCLRTTKKRSAGRICPEMGAVSAGGNVGFMDVEGVFVQEKTEEKVANRLVISRNCTCRN